VTVDEFETLVDEALAELPEEIAGKVDNVLIVVEDRPSREQDPSGDGLLGLYEGISLLDRGIDYAGAMPDRITIFREPHLAMGLSDDDLRAEIRKTVLHEMAHHLGIDDRRLHQLGWD
jgi:predicted Zn-dependent protease with MMP-like domain